MPTFQDLVIAVFCANVYPRTPDVASAANGALAAFIQANGPQTFTDTNSGLVSQFISFGDYPGYRVVPVG
jgi:hypothetical protein